MHLPGSVHALSLIHIFVGKIVEMEKQEGTHLTKCVVDCGDYGHDIRISTRCV